MSENYYTTNITTWNQFAQISNSWNTELNLYSKTLLNFLSYLSNPASQILELAAGPGLIASFLSRHNPQLQFLITDGAPAMVELARENNPKAQCQTLCYDQLHLLNGQFDAVIFSFGLPYVDKIKLTTLLDDIIQKMHKGGIFYISYIVGNYSDSGLYGGSLNEMKCYMFFYEPEYLQQLLQSKGFALKEIHDITDQSTHSFQSKQQVIIAQLLKTKSGY